MSKVFTWTAPRSHASLSDAVIAVVHRYVSFAPAAWLRAVASGGPLRLGLILWVLAFAIAASGASAAPLRLQDALRLLAERGPESAVVRSLVGLAEADVVTARMIPNPGLTVGLGRSEPVISASLQLRLPILGQRGAHVRAAQRGVDQSRAEARQSLWHLRHEARVAYYNAARGDEEVRISREVEALTRKVADIASERFETGAGNRLEKEQAGLLHVRAVQDVSDRRAAARVAHLELGRLLGGDDASELSDPLGQVGETPGLDALLQQAHGDHPGLRALFAEREAALARRGAGRADRRPLIVLDIGGELLESSTCTDNILTNGPRCIGPRGALSLDLPVFNLNGGPIARAEAEAHIAESKLRAAVLRVETAVRAAYEAHAAATIRARFFDQEYVPTANSVERMAREGFSAGHTGLLPLLEAERSVLEARLSRAEALFAVQVARADLEEASGVPLSTP